MNLPYSVVLASGSPRRRELLGEIVEDFEILVSDVNEDALTVEDPWETAEALARAKAAAVAALRPDALVIGGDTVVALVEEGSKSEQLAKPTDLADACRMLRALSGKRHVVVTGVSLHSPTGATSFTEATYVTFRDLTEEEITAYVHAERPLDKAGAYGLQGGAAGFVHALDGSRTNVIGLPVERLRAVLGELKFE